MLIFYRLVAFDVIMLQDEGLGRTWAHLANVTVATALAVEFEAADGTDDVLVAFDLVDEEVLVVVEVLIAAGAVFVFRVVLFVLLHLSLGRKETVAIGVSAAHSGGRD